MVAHCPPQYQLSATSKMHTCEFRNHRKEIFFKISTSPCFVTWAKSLSDRHWNIMQENIVLLVKNYCNSWSEWFSKIRSYFFCKLSTKIMNPIHFPTSNHTKTWWLLIHQSVCHLLDHVKTHCWIATCINIICLFLFLFYIRTVSFVKRCLTDLKKKIPYFY